MVKVGGLWVHQDSGGPGANWERILEEVRDRAPIQSLLQGKRNTRSGESWTNGRSRWPNVQPDGTNRQQSAAEAIAF